MMQTPIPQAQMQSAVPTPNPALVQTPAPQISQIAPPGSPRQMAYENMTKETSDFIKGMLDAALPLLVQKAYECSPKEIQEGLAEKYAKEEAEKKAKEQGFFDGWLGTALCIGAGVGAGYLAHEYINEPGAVEEDTMTALDAIETLLS
jgi:hypothetical protein